jgi:hypothetical protein
MNYPPREYSSRARLNRLEGQTDDGQEPIDVQAFIRAKAELFLGKRSCLSAHEIISREFLVGHFFSVTK